jgi:hypothetical protein
MLTESEKNKLMSVLLPIIRESIFENGYLENFYQEKKDDDEDKDYSKDEPDDDDDDDEYDSANDDEETSQIRKVVMKWLDSAQELHSVLSYRLYPNITKGGARSKFSKKYNGEDDRGRKYDFSPKEVNKLYNMRNEYIENSALDTNIE